MNLPTWIFRVLTWDGLLPICLVATPSLIHWLLPNNRGAIEVTAVGLPIVAFLTRAVVGGHHIASNNCPRGFRTIQYGVFYLALFVFVLVDCFMILTHIMPKAALGKGDYLVFAVLIGAYLFLMAIAMYPGPAKELPEVLKF